MKLSIHLPSDPAIQLLGIFPHDTWMFTADLFVITPNWQPPRYSSTNEWINKSWYILTMEYYSMNNWYDIMDKKQKQTENKKP